MSQESYIEFAENPEPRAAVIVLIDVSPSMEGEKLRMAQQGMEAFLRDLQEDSLANKRAEVCLIGFAGDTQVLSGFRSPSDVIAPQLRIAGGGTAIGSAVNEAFRVLGERKAMYNQSGIAYYRPWIVLITDGEPTDGQPAFDQARQLVHAEEERGGVVFLALGVPGADMGKLNQLSARRAIGLKEVQSFREFFMWLSASMRSVSRSRTGEKVNLPPIGDWSQI